MPASGHLYRLTGSAMRIGSLEGLWCMKLDDPHNGLFDNLPHMAQRRKLLTRLTRKANNKQGHEYIYIIAQTRIRRNSRLYSLYES